MSKKRVICGVTVHTLTTRHGHGFDKVDAHPCYLSPEHEAEHRC